MHLDATKMDKILLCLLSVAVSGVVSFSTQMPGTHISDFCTSDKDCFVEFSVCVKRACVCHEDYPVTNDYNLCGKAARLSENCTFDEQCEATLEETKCQDKTCVCKYDKIPSASGDGCVVPPSATIDVSIDPTMIVILVVMILMFITICVVLRLFSRARWRENRTIFNTPNPRLMNASLLGDSKLGHSDRRGSKSTKAPSRQSSMASIKTHSPVPHDSRRGSATSTTLPVSSPN